MIENGIGQITTWDQLKSLVNQRVYVIDIYHVDMEINIREWFLGRTYQIGVAYAYNRNHQQVFAGIFTQDMFIHVAFLDLTEGKLLSLMFDNRLAAQDYALFLKMSFSEAYDITFTEANII